MLTSCNINLDFRLKVEYIIGKSLLMNIFDLIVYVALAWAVFNGWRRGFLLQMLSLVAVAAAVYLGIRFGVELGVMIGLEGTSTQIGGFIAIFFGALIAIAVVGLFVRGVFRLAGLGIVDTLLGILFSVAKMLLIVSVLFSWFGALNHDYKLASQEKIASSRWFEPVSGVIDYITPYFNELTDKFL